MTGTFVALLRGINVGGRNLIRMPALAACFEVGGFEDVVTYIQSGNVVFRSSESDPDEVARRIEGILASTFGLVSRVALRSLDELRAVIGAAPDGFGLQGDRYRYDVIFLIPPLTADGAIGSVSIRDGVDQVDAGPGVLYFSRLIERASESRLSRLVSSPIYPSTTTRNWNTTTKLLSLMVGSDSARDPGPARR